MPIPTNPTPPPPYQTPSKYEARKDVPPPPFSTSPTANEKKSGCGCWFYGCFSLILIFIGFILAIYFGIKHLGGKIENLSSAQSVVTNSMLEKYSQADFDKTLKKVESFIVTLSTAKGEPEISLSADEVNSLIAFHPDLAQVRGKFFVEIPQDSLITYGSLPLNELGMEGKYLNVKAEWKIQYIPENLTVFVRNIEIAGMKLPEVVSEKIDAKNIGDEIMSDPKNKEQLSVIEKIQIAQGKIIIRVKKSSLPIKFDEAPPEIRP